MKSPTTRPMFSMVCPPTIRIGYVSEGSISISSRLAKASDMASTVEPQSGGALTDTPWIVAGTLKQLILHSSCCLVDAVIICKSPKVKLVILFSSSPPPPSPFGLSFRSLFDSTFVLSLACPSSHHSARSSDCTLVRHSIRLVAFPSACLFAYPLACP